MTTLILMNIEEEQSTFYLVLINLTDIGSKKPHYMEGIINHSIPAIQLVI